jgi:CHAT domain-containing protein/tetratricopeptide (TPR) repeat protein
MESTMDEDQETLEVSSNAEHFNLIDDQEEGFEDDLDEQIIESLRDKIEAADEGLPSLPSLLRELGVRLLMRFSTDYNLQDIDEAICLIKRAIGSTTVDDVNQRSELLFDLGNAFDMKYSETGDMTELDESIKAMRECVNETSTNKLERELRLIALASRLRTKFSKTRAIDDVEEAILVTQILVDATSEPKSRARNLGNLGYLNVLKYEISGSVIHLDDAIKAMEKVVEITPLDHPSRGRRIRDLGLRREMRYSRRGEIVDLDIAIRLLQESIKVTPRSEPNRAEWLHSFGIHLGHRYLRIGALADLEEGIRALQEGIEITKDIDNRNQERPGLLYHLGVQFLWRYERLKEDADLVDAIQALEEASKSPGASGADMNRRASSMGSLSNALFAKYKTTRTLIDLEEAIRVARESIDITEKDNLKDASQANNLCIGLNNLALMFEERYVRLGDISDIADTIRTQRECLSVAPEGHPHIAAWRLHLSLQLERRWLVTGSVSDHTEAISLSMSALNQPNSYPRTRIKAGRHAVRLCAIVSDWQQASKAAGAAMRLIPTMVLQSLENSDKQQLIGQNFGLASDAAAVALNAGEPPHVCLRLLEQGRSILAESLQNLRTNSLGLRGKHPELEQKYVGLLQELDQPDLAELEADSLSWEARACRRYAASRQLEVLLGEIRNKSGFEDFLLPPSDNEIQSAASRGPIILVNVSKYRCDAFIVDSKHIRSLRLLDLDKNDIEKRIQDRSPGSPATLEWLWDTVTSPVLDFLGFNCPPVSENSDGAAFTHWPHVWWIPTGPLRRFPLHASGRYASNKSSGDSVLDRVMSSYSLSIKSMIHGQRQQTVTQSLPSTTQDKMLVVAMSDTPDQNRLPFAAQEVKMLHELCKQISLFSVEPGRRKDDILPHLPNCKIFHFAGHGYTDNVDPTQSSLLLSDWQTNRLTVATLMALNLGAHQQAPFLAYLSACGTGRTEDPKFVDESIHLMSACQLAGFRHVIGTLWEVNDQSCVEMARITYEVLRDGQMSHDSVCLGLHRASREMRKRWLTTLPAATASEMRDDLDEANIKLPTRTVNSSSPEALQVMAIDRGGEEEREGKLNIKDRKVHNFARPLHWVPYVHFG